MSAGIYKITNLINNKVYIGQSQDIETRWQTHCRPSSCSVIANAIRKYGKNNFSFEILEKCSIDDLDDREEYYMHKYNSIVPNGYNIEEKVGNNRNIFYNYSKTDFLNIVHDIKNTSYSFLEIANKYNLDVSMIYHINRGSYHVIKDEIYPLRAVKCKRDTKHCVDCGKEVYYTSTRCVNCDYIHRQLHKRPTRKELKNLIRNNSFIQIGKIYNVSDGAIRKWCKKEGLPFKSKVIKSITNEEWNNL